MTYFVIHMTSLSSSLQNLEMKKIDVSALGKLSTREISVLINSSEVVYPLILKVSLFLFLEDNVIFCLERQCTLHLLRCTLIPVLARN